MTGFWLRDQHPDQADHRRGQHQHRPQGQRDPTDVQVRERHFKAEFIFVNLF